jgi:hypothetical protein
MDKKRLKKEYRETPRQMGVFLIRNIANDKVFLGAGLDLVGTMNRHKFQLTNGSHPNARLQSDWNEVGSRNFAFEIIDQITPLDDPAFDSKAELEFMEKLWLQELQPFDGRGYNQRKLSRGEMLARIAADRSDEL